jgi:hypothetical protein
MSLVSPGIWDGAALIWWMSSTVDSCTPSRRAISASCPPLSPLPGLFPRRRLQRPRPDQPRRAPRCAPPVQYRHIVLRQPITAPTCFPGNPICRSTATATFRIPVSSSANRNSAVFPAKTTSPVPAEHPQVGSFWYALRDGRSSGRRHTQGRPEFNALGKMGLTNHPKSERGVSSHLLKIWDLGPTSPSEI